MVFIAALLHEVKKMNTKFNILFMHIDIFGIFVNAITKIKNTVY